MNLKKFNRRLRRAARAKLAENVNIIQSVSFSEKDDRKVVKEKIDQIMDSPVEGLGLQNYFRSEDYPKANKVLLATYNSDALNNYMSSATKKFSEDAVLIRCVTKLIENKSKLSWFESRYIINTFLKDDAFLTDPIRIVFQDKNLRDAMEIPDDLSPETYIKDVQDRIRSASSLEDVTDVANFQSSPVAFPTVFVAVAVVVAAAAILVVAVSQAAAVQAWAAAWVVARYVAGFDSVITAAGTSLDDLDLTGLNLRDDDISSICVNNSDSFIWTVVMTKTGYKRFALPPGKSSIGYGIPEVEAILIGGKNNKLQALFEESAEEPLGNGAYMLGKNSNDPAIVSIELVDGKYQIMSNAVQKAAESAARAGYTDLEGGGVSTENYNPKFRMDRIASISPIGFDIPKAVARAAESNHFYQSMRLYSMMENYRGKVKNQS